MTLRSSGADCVLSRSFVHSHRTSAPFYPTANNTALLFQAFTQPYSKDQYLQHGINQWQLLYDGKETVI